jgi:hypothetical protein
LPEWSHTQLFGPTPGGAASPAMAPAMSPPGHMLAVPGTVLGKRSRGAESVDNGWEDLGPSNNYQPCPSKKGKEVMEVTKVLEVTGSSSRGRRRPAARTHTRINKKSKMAGRGAGRLATPNVPGVPHQPLLGPSIQQALVWPATPEKPTWIEGKAEGGTQHHENSMVGPQVPTKHGNEQVEELFKIPPRLKERHRALLAATQANWECAVVEMLKCRLCPDADFSDFEDFKRHCDTSEAHPSKISFCNHCGDFFARRDGLKRHHDKPPGECINAVADKAELKRRETVRAHKAFEEKLARWLRTGEEIGMPFAHLIKEMFPNSSKKGSKQQSRLPIMYRLKSRAEC